MQHPNTVQVAAKPRLRPHSAPSKPALHGAGGRLTMPLDRDAVRRIACNVDMLIDFLDAIDDTDVDSDGVEDAVLASQTSSLTCPEHDEDCEPSLGWTADGVVGSDVGSDLELDTADDEPTPDDTGEPTDDDLPDREPVRFHAAAETSSPAVYQRRWYPGDRETAK